MHHDATAAKRSGSTSTTWHLCWQAAVGRDLFPHPTLSERIRYRLIDAHKARGRVLIDYSLLPTEIHVVAQIPSGSVPGDVARAIGNVVARWVREAQPVRSPVFAGPFRAHLLSSDDELRQQVRMLAWRPVALGLCRRPTHCAHGALRISLGMTPARGFDARPLLRLFGETVSDARDALRRWIRQRPTDRDWRAWELARGLALAAGTVGPQPTMAREVKSPEAAALIAVSGTEGIDGALRLLTEWVTARLGGRGVLQLGSGSDAASARGRALVARLAVAHALCSAASVARYFGRSKATLCEQMKSSRARQSDSPIVVTPVRRIIDDVMALGSIESSRRSPLSPTPRRTHRL
jgi:hypothetical protein